jgi:arsenate reductase (glutaredoxin)
MTLTLYSYKNCGTCRKAKKFLNSRGVNFVEIPIREQPPTKSELKRMISALTINRLFNTAGKTYRELNLKDKRNKLSMKELIDLLASNGNLIKRPFAIGSGHGKEIMLTGFKEDEWKKLFP